jgi:hypothetical protein
MKPGYKVSIFIIVIMILLAISGCSQTNMVEIIPSQTKLTPTSFLTTVSKPTATEVFRQNLAPTATDIQLPYNLVNESSEYCQPPSGFLPIKEAENLTDDEIGYRLIDIWLSRYKKAEAHPYCRIAGYIINMVYYDERISSLPLEPKGDFTRVADFSIKLIQVPNDWMSFSGRIDQKNWLHLVHAFASLKMEEGYSMKFAFP